MLQKDLKWLGYVPLSDLEKIRKRGELENLRDVIGKNIQSIENASDEDFVEVGNQVRYNIETALDKHSAEVADLNRKYRSQCRLNISSIVVSGTLGFAAWAYPPLALGAAIMGGGSVFNSIQDYLHKRQSDEELRKKPVAMLFNAKRWFNSGR